MGDYIEMAFYVRGTTTPPTIAQVTALESMARLVPGFERFVVERKYVGIYGEQIRDGKVVEEVWA
jgi:hypothetical protein